MNTNTDSFTDEQMLNLVNNYIDKNTKFEINDFTGGYVSVTINTSRKQDTCKVALLFGYKNRNSQSVIFEIDEHLIYIWIKAIRLKIESLKIDNTGMDFNQINGLMNTSYEPRTKTHCTSTSTSYQFTFYQLPITNSEIKNLKGFIDVKHFLQSKNKDENGKQYVFIFDENEISISDKGIPYYRINGGNLPHLDADIFFQAMYEELKELLQSE